ncbi:hypothetical protein F751_0267 [Auxenochlorella protothecoides]|uniref:Uncharacterized protein n=1 Tax=Auxenochlorella protothecoides TaxID=3075 RepID=A0A087SS22_AUXPR|nr:hypothetical protein F751_0267 [Auxenochlorella protothecoides]KFM28526.1 hypothetical protein F751_0267 [Auxenochlorella protothecoides]
MLSQEIARHQSSQSTHSAWPVMIPAGYSHAILGISPNQSSILKSYVSGRHPTCHVEGWAPAGFCHAASAWTKQKRRLPGPLMRAALTRPVGSSIAPSWTASTLCRSSCMCCTVFWRSEVEMTRCASPLSACAAVSPWMSSRAGPVEPACWAWGKPTSAVA